MTDRTSEATFNHIHVGNACVGLPNGFGLPCQVYDRSHYNPGFAEGVSEYRCVVEGLNGSYYCDVQIARGWLYRCTCDPQGLRGEPCPHIRAVSQVLKREYQ